MSKTMLLTQPVHFFDKKNVLVKYEPGIQEIPDDHADNPYFEARGAKVFDPKQIAKEAAEKAAAAKLVADTAEATALLAAAKEGGDQKKIDAAQKALDKLLDAATK